MRLRGYKETLAKEGTRTGRPLELSMADEFRACQFNAAIIDAASACGSGRPPGIHKLKSETQIRSREAHISGSCPSLDGSRGIFFSQGQRKYPWGESPM